MGEINHYIDLKLYQFSKSYKKTSSGTKTTFSATTPVSPKINDIWINTSYQTKQYWNGTGWILITGGI